MEPISEAAIAILQSHMCKNCGKDDDERPTIFKGLPYCSINCAKALGEMT